MFRPIAIALLAAGCAAFCRAADGSPPASAQSVLEGPVRIAKPSPRAASDQPQRALKMLRPAEHLTVELFAAEPMLGNPVSLSIDNQGRVFVAETWRSRSSALDIRHYPLMLEDDLASRSIEDRLAFTKKYFATDWPKLAIETEVIRLLEDRSHSGQADFSTIYADGFGSVLEGAAGGVLASDGSVWFTNIPSLWKLDGVDKEGHAEKREELSRGYGVRFGFTGHDLHGLIMGPDGRLYFTCGDRGTNVKTKEGRTLALPDEGAVFRCEPDGSHLEIFCRGLRNPQDLAFDKFGNLFTGDDGAGIGDQGRWLYLVEDGDYGWRVGYQHHRLGQRHNPWLAEKLWVPHFDGQAAYLLPPVANIPDGPAGLAYNPGTGLSPFYEDNFFQCCFKGSAARSNIMTWKARRYLAGFMPGEQTVFVDHCQATDITFGPDSKIYFTDWGDGWEATGRGRIFRAFDPAEINSPPVEQVRLLLAEGFKNKVTAELSPLLGHKDQRIRLQAQWELATRPQAESEFADVAAFSTKDAPDQPLARIHAIWGLGSVARRAEYRSPGAAAKILAPLIKLLEDGDVEVRAQAAKVLGENRVAEACDALMKTLRDPVEHVSFFSAQALARLARKEAVTQLLIVARSAGEADPFLRHACVTALAAANDFPALQEAAEHVDPQVRMVALLTMRRLERPEIARFLADENPSLVIEAARAIYDVPIHAALPQLAALLAKPTNDEQLTLRALNAAFHIGTAASAQALAAFTAKDGASESLRTEAVQILALWPQPPARDRVTGLPRALPARDPAPALAALQALAEKRDLPETLRKEIAAARAGFGH